MIKIKNTHPLCFDSLAQYSLWKAAARQSNPGGSHICADCTPDYQSKMITANRCAKPLARFIKQDGEMVGKAKWRE